MSIIGASVTKRRLLNQVQILRFLSDGMTQTLDCTVMTSEVFGKPLEEVFYWDARSEKE